MKVLFYLPVITDRYFEGLALPLMRVMARDAEVHVAAPPQWSMTGLTARQISLCADMPNIHWHILDGEEHPLLRTAPADPEALIDFVRGIGPDYTFCRSADVTTPGRFPGKTRFMMEPVIPPLALRPDVRPGMMLDGPRLYDQGFMPELDPRQRSRLDALFSPAWHRARARYEGGTAAREAYLAQAGLPADRKIIALPLNVEAAANFFIKVHSATPSNVQLIEALATEIGDEFVLALTKHPLNIHGDPVLDRSVEPIEPVVEQYRDRVRIVDAPGPAGNATASLIQHCDGSVICDSKSFGYAAFFGKPILRLSRYASAPWMRAYTELSPFLDDIRSGAAEVPIAKDAATWFGFHYANNVFPADKSLTTGELVDRFEKPVDPDRWQAGLARLEG